MNDVPHHSREFRRRRFLNWFPMGLTYAFLYMGRYNLTVAKNALGEAMTKEDFGLIFGAGTVTYALAFLLNGPLTDRFGGRRGILIAALGSAICNLAMGLYIHIVLVASGKGPQYLTEVFVALYSLNMYFQSFGAVSIVKVNAHWFHVRERGGFGGIFGTMIASGIFFAFTVNGWILDAVSDPAAPTQLASSMWVFYVPSAILVAMYVIEFILLRDRPGLAGFPDFDTGDASSGEMDKDIPLRKIVIKVLTNPIIVTVALIEFCTGVLRNGVMHWFPIYRNEVLCLPPHHYLAHGTWGEWYISVLPFFVLAAVFFFLATKAKGKKFAWFVTSGGIMALAPFVQGGWGGLLMVAGVLGANIAGWVSDLFFQSRRGPVAGLLYAGLVLGCVGMFFTLGQTSNEVRWVDKSLSNPPKGYDALKVGDKITEIAGKSGIKNWEQVTQAVACLPAKCVDSHWDMKACMCKSNPEEVAPKDLKVSTGVIHATVIRDSKIVHLKLKDPAPQLRAGDKRKLKAGPVLAVNELWLGLVLVLVSICVIGSHGILSGTATMDFGGRKAAATAVGLIDGFVYLGTAVQSVSLGYLTTQSWDYWPIFLLPFGIMGVLLAYRIRKALPKGVKRH